MRERREILKLWRVLADAGQPGVLATVVRTEGSSYRLPGARLLLGPDGQHAGGISGGCLEDDILKRAWWLTANGPVIRKYDTTPDGELATEGYGLGCNGVIHVLLERVTSEVPAVLPILDKVNQSRRAITVVHAVSAAAAGQHFLLGDNDTNPFDVAAKEVFVETITPPTHLLVFGAGDDAIPVTELAHYLGWQVSIFDGRAHYARAARFPLADRVQVRAAGSPAPEIDDWTVAVTMTHSYSQDREAVELLAGKGLRYLGVLGPRKRTRQLLADLGLEEGTMDSSLHGPMGLDLGGHGPELVALSVMAEIQSVLNGRNSGSLRDLVRPIHSGVADSPSPEEAWVRSIVCT